jgi:hypothetical protein
MARSIQGAPEPDDTARLDDEEEAELMQALALSSQEDKARPQAPPDKIGTASGTSVEPGGARPGIRTDMTCQLNEVKGPAKITQQHLRKTVVHAD